MNRDKELRHVMRNSKISLGARVLAWELAQWISDDQDVCVRSQQQIADDLGVHRNSIIRWVQELRDLGLLTDVPFKTLCAYSLHLDKPAPSSTSP